ncbi:MAG: hypothetical protein AAFR46_16695 [Pseudomonadota bacterium]
MSADPWSWAEQRRDTELSYRELSREAGLAPGTRITLDLVFLASETDCDEAGLVKALKRAGYSVEIDPEDGTVEASVENVPFTVEAIWTHEEKTTRIALPLGYAPDGWGFFEPG